MPMRLTSTGMELVSLSKQILYILMEILFPGTKDWVWSLIVRVNFVK